MPAAPRKEALLLSVGCLCCLLLSTHAFVQAPLAGLSAPRAPTIANARPPSGSRAGTGMVMMAAEASGEEEAVRVQTIEGFTKKAGDAMKGKVDDKFLGIMEEFLEGYSSCATRSTIGAEEYQNTLGALLKFLPEALSDPYQFDLFHKAIEEPFDYYTWGNNFFKPMVEMDKSKVEGVDNMKKVAEYLEAGENVVLFSNHQTEADPQVISMLMESHGLGDTAKKLINVAGHKVTTDPLAIPFSKGRNLFCIYSKKYIEDPPEEKEAKSSHNQRTLGKIQEMMSEKDQGEFIWVAPSGGRDRPAPGTKDFIVSDFDYKSVEMFKLMAMIAGRETEAKTHFFPFAMWTNKLVPPPDEVNVDVGEKRTADRGPVSICFCDELAPEKAEPRFSFAKRVEASVKEAYAQLDAFHAQQ